MGELATERSHSARLHLVKRRYTEILFLDNSTAAEKQWWFPIPSYAELAKRDDPLSFFPYRKNTIAKTP